MAGCLPPIHSHCAAAFRFTFERVERWLFHAKCLLVTRGGRSLTDTDQDAVIYTPANNGRIEFTILAQSALKGIGQRKLPHLACVGVQRQSGLRDFAIAVIAPRSYFDQKLCAAMRPAGDSNSNTLILKPRLFVNQVVLAVVLRIEEAHSVFAELRLTRIRGSLGNSLCIRRAAAGFHHRRLSLTGLECPAPAGVPAAQGKSVGLRLGDQGYR